MKVTDTYKSNIKAIEKYITTMSFSEESENRIRQFINNPLEVVNDKIKALFEKYDDYVVDYRIQLPSSMLKKKDDIVELTIAMDTIANCLCEELNFTYDTETQSFAPKITISPDTLLKNYFMVGNEKRKAWKYLASKANSMAISVVAAAKTIYDFVDLREFYPAYFSIFTNYINSLGSRVTLLKTKIKQLYKDAVVRIADYSSNDLILKVADLISRMINITQEIVSTKTVDTDKFQMYLSFNVFDWLLASTGETWHSCIDMNSSYCYGLGLLGMCGCPDWGMLLYTDGTTKTVSDIETYHIVSRSWVMLSKNNKFQMIGWYPKDIREGVTINCNPCEGITFAPEYERNAQSYSEWEPITFRNGAVAWIYSDANRFYSCGDRKIQFRLEGSTGIPYYRINSSGNLEPFNGLEKYISIASSRGCIQSCVNKKYIIHDYYDEYDEDDEDEVYYCDICGNSYDSSDDLYWIEREERYVCSDCIDSSYVWCEMCEEYVHIDDTTEVYFGPHEWDYNLYCTDCANNDDFYYDNVAEKMYDSNSVESFIIRTDNGYDEVSEFTLNFLLSERKIEQIENSSEYKYIN